MMERMLGFPTYGLLFPRMKMLYFAIFCVGLLQGCSIFGPKTVEDCQKRDREQCFDCLVDINPEGYRVYQEQIQEKCYCGFECSEKCTDFCASATQEEPQNSCAECFQAVAEDPLSICLSDFLDECVEDEECLMFILALKECEGGEEN